MSRILIAEDSPTQSILIRALLEADSHEVAVAENGIVALRQISEFRPDIVLTDMHMPEMNGLELVNAMRLQHPQIPAVLITAKGTDSLAVEALQQGAAGYIPKANLNDMLSTTIDEVLGLMRADRTYAQLIECLHFNEFRFTLTNDVALIAPLVDLMQQMAMGMGLCDAIGRVRIGVAVEHALLNSLYHGNLELSHEELEPSSGSQLVEERLAQAPYCDRKIHFSVQLTPSGADFVVRDDGPGFDTSSLPNPDDPHLLDRRGGRGLVLIQSFMDKIEFNEKGNELKMSKRRDSRTAEPPSDDA